MRGEISTGQLASFCMYSEKLAGSLDELSTAMSGVTKAQGAGARLFYLLCCSKKGSHAKLASPPPSLSGTSPPSICFRDVSFAYPTRPDAPVLCGINLCISPGQVVGVAGHSGSGKSTLTMLLLQMYACTSGSITLGELNIERLPEDLHIGW